MWKPGEDPNICDELMEEWLSAAMDCIARGMSAAELLTNLQALVGHLSEGKRAVTLKDGAAPEIDTGRQLVNGRDYIGDGKGGLVPVELVKPQHLLEDEEVRKVMAYAVDLSARVARFKVHTFEDLGALEALLAQEYEAPKRGRKGNRTFMTHDGLQKIVVQVHDAIDFGPELQTAKTLVDECLNEWAADAGPELRAIVTRAFNTDKTGQINRAEIFTLLRLEIEDARWKRAMDAVRDAMRVVGSRTYVRCYRREAFDGEWAPVTIDLARA